MDPQPRPPRSALLAALRNNGTTEELRGIGYAVDLQGNWLADSLIFTTDRLEGNLDNLPLGPRQILERRAAAYMPNAPARPSYVPARSISRPLGSNRPSATSTWGCPSPDPHLLPRPGTDAWYEYKFGPTATPTPAPMASLSFADSSVVASLEEYHDDDDDRDDTADKDNDEGIEREDEDGHDWLILSTVPPTPAPLSAPSATLADSSVITSPAEYQDDYEDEEDENEEDDTEGHYEDDTHAQISATVMWDRQPANPFVSPARVFAPAPPAPTPGPARLSKAPTPTPSQIVPTLPASSLNTADEHYQDDDKDDRDDTGPLAFPAVFPAPTPTPASAPAPNPGVPAAAAPTAIRLTSTRFPAGFQLWITTYRKRNKRFLVGPNYTGGPIQLPPKTFEFQYTLDNNPKRQEGCRWCGCSNWLWDPYFFMRTTNPDGRQDTCNRCVFRSRTKEPTRRQQLNDWLVENQPVMFWLARGDF